jgi:hypothetical protein
MKNTGARRYPIMHAALIVGPLFFGIIGLFAFFRGSADTLRGLVTYVWATAPGVVTSSAVARVTSADEVQFTPKIEYEFTVAGTKHVGNRLWVSAESSSRVWAEGIAQEYPVGKAVSVRFDPDAPGEAVLEAGPTMFSLVMRSLGLFYVAVSLAAFRYRRRIIATLPGAEPAVMPTRAKPTVP